MLIILLRVKVLRKSHNRIMISIVRPKHWRSKQFGLLESFSFIQIRIWVNANVPALFFQFYSLLWWKQELQGHFEEAARLNDINDIDLMAHLLLCFYQATFLPVTSATLAYSRQTVNNECFYISNFCSFYELSFIEILIELFWVSSRRLVMLFFFFLYLVQAGSHVSIEVIVVDETQNDCKDRK